MIVAILADPLYIDVLSSLQSFYIDQQYGTNLVNFLCLYLLQLQ